MNQKTIEMVDRQAIRGNIRVLKEIEELVIDELTEGKVRPNMSRVGMYVKLVWCAKR